jgi:hypothetical protein
MDLSVTVRNTNKKALDMRRMKKVGEGQLMLAS